MSFVRSFTGYRPAPREDGLPWTTAKIYEAPDVAGAPGSLTLIETITLDPVDTDPEQPRSRDLTTTNATLETGWYRVIFLDAAGDQDLTDPVAYPSADQPYFTLAEFRARYPDITDVKKSDDQVDAARAIAEQAFEDAAGRAFVPRTTTETLYSPNGSSAVRINHPGVTQVATAIDGDGAAIDITSLAIDGSWLTVDDGWPLDLGPITITYTYGASEPPLRVKQAVMLLTRSWLLEGPIDKRATQLAVEGGGSINLATPGLLGSTFGIPEVDAALAQYGASLATMS